MGNRGGDSVESKHGWLYICSKAGKYHAGWQKSVFLGSLAQGLWSSALCKVSARCRAWQGSAAPLPLCVGPLLSDVIPRAIEKRSSFQTPCVAGAQLFSPLSFPIYLDDLRTKSEPA